jgi:hypothetical protein
MHLWEGWKHPNSSLLAALTTAVMSVKVVISPFHSEMLIVGRFALAVCEVRSMEMRGGIKVADVRILLSRWYIRTWSIAERTLEGNGGSARL